MAKNKIEIGQCYEYHDRVFMVMQRWGDGHWMVQDTLTKEDITNIPEAELLTWRRPFTNCG